MHGSAIRMVGAPAIALAAMVVLTGAGPEPRIPFEDERTPVADLPPGQAYKIGALFALTGPAASLGDPQSKTALMLQEQINAGGGVRGHRLQIIIRDTKGQEVEALLAARELVETENVLAIVGPSRVGTTLAIASYIERSQVPLMSCGAAPAISSPVKRWIFQVAPSAENALQRVCTYLADHGITRIAVLVSDNAFGYEGHNALDAQTPEAGITIVADEEFLDCDTGFTPQLTRIKGTDAQAVVCWGLGPAPAIIAREMRRLNMRLPLLASLAQANQRFIDAAMDAANGAVMPAPKLLIAHQLPDADPQKSVLLEFASRYEERCERKPEMAAGHAWDGIKILCAALEMSGPDRAALHDEIERTSNFVGIGGIYSYSTDDHHGLTTDDLAMVQIVDGEWKLIK